MVRLFVIPTYVPYIDRKYSEVLVDSTIGPLHSGYRVTFDGTSMHYGVNVVLAR